MVLHESYLFIPQVNFLRVQEDPWRRGTKIILHSHVIYVVARRAIFQFFSILFLYGNKYSKIYVRLGFIFLADVDIAQHLGPSDMTRRATLAVAILVTNLGVPSIYTGFWLLLRFNCCFCYSAPRVLKREMKEEEVTFSFFSPAHDLVHNKFQFPAEFLCFSPHPFECAVCGIGSVCLHQNY